MAAFPALSRIPGSSSYTEELNKNAVKVGSKASGLPVLNKLVTFDAKTFKHTLNLVSQADKESVITHYKATCDVPFNWDNEQEDGTTYEVIYGAPPKCKLDKVKERWKITLILIQYS